MLILPSIVDNLGIDNAIPSGPILCLLIRVVWVVDLRVIAIQQEDNGRWIDEFGVEGLHLRRVFATRTYGFAWITDSVIVEFLLGVSECKVNKELQSGQACFGWID